MVSELLFLMVGYWYSTCQIKIRKIRLAQLRCVVNDVNLFTRKRWMHVDFLTEVDEKKAFLLIGGTMGQRVVPLIHDIPQLDTIYFLCRNTSRVWTMVQSMGESEGRTYRNVAHMRRYYDMLLEQCDAECGHHKLSFLAWSGLSVWDLNQLEPSFMYTQTIKINNPRKWITTNHQLRSLLTYCRNGDCGSPTNIANRFEDRIPCWISDLVVYVPIVRIFDAQLRSSSARSRYHNQPWAFFIRDLNQQIERLHHQTKISDYHGKPFVVYRGQALSTTDFWEAR